jgi:outer membrane protein TolC
MVGLGVSIPVWRDKSRAQVDEAQSRADAAQAARHAVANKTRAEVKVAYFRLQNARRLVELYDKTLIPQAERAMDAAQQWHQEENVTDISGFLETQGVWLNFRLARLRAATDYLQYVARIERLMGIPLGHAQRGLDEARKDGETEQ